MEELARVLDLKARRSARGVSPVGQPWYQSGRLARGLAWDILFPIRAHGLKSLLSFFNFCALQINWIMTSI